MKHLLFTLQAPMGAFGDIAVGEKRGSWDRPGKSGVIGLIAAACGIGRGDEDRMLPLRTGLCCAVLANAAGREFTDFHTVQSPEQPKRGVVLRTRKDEVEADAVQTKLTKRDWRVDFFFTVCVWAKDGADVDVHALADALRRPAFALYVGRRAAPLALPLDPEVVDAATYRDAFHIRRGRTPANKVLAALTGRNRRGDNTIAVDADVPGGGVGRETRRRDEPGAGRTFSDRRVRIEKLPSVEQDYFDGADGLN